MTSVRLLVLGLVVWSATAMADTPSPLRVMTYNLNYANPDVARTLDAIDAEDADVVLLQEIDAAWKRALEKRFAKRYAHRSFHLHTRSPGGLGVLSKHPIDDERILPAPSGWFPASLLVVAGPFGALQILNVHLRPAIDNGSWVKGYFTTRPIRVREIKDYVSKLAAALPTIIAGDFNEAPDGAAVDFLSRRGFTRARTSGPSTWHYRDTLAMDIDHVIVNGNLVAKDAVVRDAGASDHRPVIVTVQPK